MQGQELTNFMTKSLNIWVQATDSQYMNIENFKKCGCDLNLEDMRGKKCTWGIDLSSGGDLTSIALEFNLSDNKYFIHSHSFIPKMRVEEHIKTDKVPYKQWILQKLLTVTETLQGVKTDYKYIINYVRKLIDKYDLELELIAYDNHNASAFLNDLEEFGVDCVEVVQSAKSLNDATVDFKLEVDAQNIQYNKHNGLLIWSFANAKKVNNSFGEIKIDKDLRTKRIDPCDAVINAHKFAMKQEINKIPELTEEYIKSFYS